MINMAGIIATMEYSRLERLRREQQKEEEEKKKKEEDKKKKGKI